MPVRKTLLCCLLTALGAVACMIDKRVCDERLSKTDFKAERDASLTGTNADSNRIPGLEPEYRLGRVLPSPGYIRDNVQYFPKGTDFPLTKELNAQQAAEAEAAERLAR